VNDDLKELLYANSELIAFALRRAGAQIRSQRIASSRTRLKKLEVSAEHMLKLADEIMLLRKARNLSRWFEETPPHPPAA
jgi:hypothetical protein